MAASRSRAGSRFARTARSPRSTLLALLLAFPFAGGCGWQGEFGALSTDRQLDGARADLASGKWSRAAQKFQTLAGKLESSPLFPEVKYGLGRAYCGMGDYPAAERELNLIVREYPDSEWADDALFTIADCLWDQARPSQLDQSVTRQTIDKVREFMNRFPESDRAADAERLLLEARGHLAKKEYENARLYLRLGDPLAARAYFQGILQDYADTEWAAWAQLGVALTYEREKNRAEAQAQFNRVIERWPDHPAAAESAASLRRLAGGSGS